MFMYFVGTLTGVALTCFCVFLVGWWVERTEAKLWSNTVHNEYDQPKDDGFLSANIHRDHGVNSQTPSRGAKE